VVNKLCALLGRIEARDLVELYFPRTKGLATRAVSRACGAEGRRLTPATVAWVLSQFHVPDDLPGGIGREALAASARELEARLRRLALPRTGCL
jgi:hypothetical protein